MAIIISLTFLQSIICNYLNNKEQLLVQILKFT
jgi:hypothetical protein